MGRVTKLRQTVIVKDYIAAFKQLAIRTDRQGDDFYLAYFINDLKEAIQAHVQMHHLATWLDACRKALDMEIALNAQSNRPNFVAKARPTQAQGPT